MSPAAVWSHVPNKVKVDLVVWLLIPFAFIGGAFLTLNFKTVTVTHVVHAAAPVGSASAAQVAAGWGQPSQSIPANQVNQNLPAQMTCYIWASKRAMLCY